MARAIVLTAIAACLFTGTAAVLSAQFKRAEPGQPSYPAQPYPSQNSAPSPYPPQQYPAPADDPGGPPPDQTADESFNSADAQHGVARLALFSGEVNVRRANGAVVAAAINAPLVTQDRVQTGSRSSAEIQIDANNLLRVAENTDLGFGDLELGRFQAQLGAGTVIYRVLRPEQMQGEVDTPNIAIRALGAGEFRISVMPDGTTGITVRSGEAEILGPGGSERLAAGHSYLVRGNPSDPEFQETAFVAPDEFDSWSEGRDRELLAAQSSQYVGAQIPGAADLDANGQWVSSSYGPVWAPSGMPPDWAPYSMGQWVYEDYYGWTWVDSAAWGWAPYHYGRWFRNGRYGWCWWPGPRVGIRYYRPALVGFFGWGAGYRGLGWAPLAPYERFHPWWGAAARPLRYGSGSILATYRNTAFRGGATFAAYNSFGGPGQRFGHLSREQLAGATILGGRVPAVPNRASYSFTRRPAFPDVRINTFSNRSFVSSRSFVGNNQARVPTFSARPTAPASPGWYRLGAGATAQRYRNSQPPRPYYGGQNATQNARPQQSRSGRGNSGWQRFGDPGNPYRQSFSGGGRSESGWHQFGRPAPSQAPRNSFGSPRGNSSGGQSQNGGNRGGGDRGGRGRR